MTTSPERPSFDGRHVLSLESRRATEVAALISTYGGRPLTAPAIREVPLESNAEALDFARTLIAGGFDVTVFLTGVGTRMLVRAIEGTFPMATFLAALARTKVVARGPKPLAVLRELEVPVWLTAPEPNTWRELLAALDARAAERPMRGARVAVQEYGVSNVDLLDELRSRGAHVTPVSVYRWALPEDLEPLKNAVAAMTRGEVDVVVFTTGVQVVHLWQIGREMGLEAELRRELARAVVASIGPTTSEELRRRGLPPDVEASHPKMGFLVREAAEQSERLLRAKRNS
jgi:uroporphyrinogen-III synthase